MMMMLPNLMRGGESGKDATPNMMEMLMQSKMMSMMAGGDDEDYGYEYAYDYEYDYEYEDEEPSPLLASIMQHMMGQETTPKVEVTPTFQEIDDIDMETANEGVAPFEVSQTQLEGKRKPTKMNQPSEEISYRNAP
jgi:hypothetical protein